MKNYLLFVFYVLLISCGENRIIDNIELKRVWSHDQFSDSTFFSKTISDIFTYSGNYYISDSFNDRVVCVDSSFVILKIFGKSGKGPGEFNFVGPIYITQDTLYAFDSRGGRINVFNVKSGSYVRQIVLEKNPDVRTKFFVYKNSIFISTPLFDYPITIFNSSGKIIGSLGERDTLNNTLCKYFLYTANLMLNDNNEMICSFVSIPKIEIHNLVENKNAVLDLSEVSVVKNRLDEIEAGYKNLQNKTSQRIPNLFIYSFLDKNQLYLSYYSEFKNSVNVCNALIISLEKSKMIKIQNMIFINNPNDYQWFFPFGVFNNSVLVYESINSNFNYYRIPYGTEH